MFYRLMGWVHMRIAEAGGQRGQGTVEYVGLILLVSLLMVGMVAAMKGFNGKQGTELAGVIVDKIKEAVDKGMRTDAAVASAIKSTAGVVTSAAVVMVAVFSIFATLSSLEFKQMGVGLAAAILIDATIIRGVLLPATMKLLGEWNWWLPSWLEWLPEVEAEPEAEPQPA